MKTDTHVVQMTFFIHFFFEEKESFPWKDTKGFCLHPLGTMVALMEWND